MDALILSLNLNLNLNLSLNLNLNLVPSPPSSLLKRNPPEIDLLMLSADGW
jgi:hypothetical protein